MVKQEAIDKEKKEIRTVKEGLLNNLKEMKASKEEKPETSLNQL